ncbi:MAG: signal peptidase II [Pseudomonadota bacterium]
MFRFGLILAGIVFVLDQISKFFVLRAFGASALDCLSRRTHGFVPDCPSFEVSSIFHLSMVWNQGVSFGMLRADGDVGRWLLVLMSFVIAGLFGWWLRSAQRPLTAWALGLVIGGALGNVIDRIRFGAVADFLNFGDFWISFPWVFNVADAGITVGAALLLLDFFIHGEEGRPGARRFPGLTGRFGAPKNGQDAE